jgi:hypothetical protein
LPAGIVVAEQTGRIILMNDHAAGILGHPDKLTSYIDEYSEYRSFYPDGRRYDPGRYPLRLFFYSLLPKRAFYGL